MNNDELQKAIDDITKETAPASTEPVAAETEALANEIAGATAPTTGEGVALAPVAEAAPVAEVPAVDIPAAPAPAVPETPAMPPVAEAPAAEPAPAGPVAPAPAPAAAPGAVATGMDDIKKEALKELYPLLDKTDMTAEEKYDICMEMQSEPDAIRNALGYAKQFTDMDKKVDALLKIYRM